MGAVLEVDGDDDDDCDDDGNDDDDDGEEEEEELSERAEADVVGSVLVSVEDVVSCADGSDGFLASLPSGGGGEEEGTGACLEETEAGRRYVGSFSSCKGSCGTGGSR